MTRQKPPRDLAKVLDQIKLVAPELFTLRDGSPAPLSRIHSSAMFTAPEAMWLRWVAAQDVLNHLEHGERLSALTKKQQAKVVAIWNDRAPRSRR